MYTCTLARYRALVYSMIPLYCVYLYSMTPLYCVYLYSSKVQGTGVLHDPTVRCVYLYSMTPLYCVYLYSMTPLYYVYTCTLARYRALMYSMTPEPVFGPLYSGKKSEKMVYKLERNLLK